MGKGDGNPFMDLAYGYDEVGNITDLANRATNNSPAQMGGATNYKYQYDVQDRPLNPLCQPSCPVGDFA